MKTIVSILLLGMVVGHAQWTKKIKGNQEQITETRQTQGYDKIHLVSFFDVILADGKEGQITIEGESNLLPFIETEVRKGKLTIDVKNNVSLRPSRNHDITITVPIEEISGLSLTGSGDIESDFTLKTENIDLNLVGSGDMELTLDSGIVVADIIGSGDITLSGNSKSFKGKVTGSGDLDAKNLKSKGVKVSILGSGDADVYSSEHLEIKVLGSGDVQYSGDPYSIEISNHSSSKIVKKRVVKSSSED